MDDDRRLDAPSGPRVPPEDLALHAVDALDATERGDVEQRLAEDPAGRAELARLRDAAGLLSEGHEVAPPASLRRALLARIQDVPQVDVPRTDENPVARTAEEPTGAEPDSSISAPADPAPAPPASGRPTSAASGRPHSRVDSTRPAGADRRRGARGRRPRRGLVLLGAAIVLAGAGLGALLTMPGTEDTPSPPSALEQVVRAQDAKRVQDASASDAGTAGQVVVIASTQRDAAVLQAQDLPPAPAGQVYQIWWLQDGGDPVSAGVFAPDSDGQARVLLKGAMGSADGAAVTIEPEGGSSLPTTDPVHVFGW